MSKVEIFPIIQEGTIAARILALIIDGPKGAAEIVAALDESLSSVTGRIAGLMRSGVIEVHSYGPKTGGRRRAIYGATKLAATAIGDMRRMARKSRSGGVPRALAMPGAPDNPFNVGQRAVVVKCWNRWKDIERIALAHTFDRDGVETFLKTRPGYPGDIISSGAPRAEQHEARRMHALQPGQMRSGSGITLPFISILAKEESR